MKYKLSYYIVTSDAINKEKDRIIYSTRSNKSFKVNDYSYDFIKNEKFDDIPKEYLDKLIEREIVVPHEENELETIIKENVEQIEKEDGDYLYEVIQPSAMCQLGCYYCGQDHTKDYLSNDLSEKICERVENKLKNGNYKSFYIGWFGAEPLMGLKQMRLINNRLKNYCEINKISYGSKVVTNGLSLKPNIYKELVDDLKVDKIEITLDGTQKDHDEHRYLKDGKGSFDLIFNNLIKIVNMENYGTYSKKCKITVRCNMDEKNPEAYPDLMDLFIEKGLYGKVAYTYPVGIYSWGGNDAHKQSLTKENFAKNKLLWSVKAINEGIQKSVGLPKRTKVVCMSVGKNSEMIDAFGNVFNCTEVSYTDFYEDTPHKLGNLRRDTHLEVENPPLLNWNEKLLNNEFQCSSCRLLPVCGGACPKSWEEGNKACPPFKFNIKEALRLHYINDTIVDEKERNDAMDTFVKELKEKELEAYY
jgi:uncharacterized protein